MANNPFRNINEVHIEISNMCNLSCKYCYAETLLPGRNQPKNLFTNELYRTTIDQILSSTKSEQLDIVFHGGEPLLHDAEWFAEACTYASDEASKRSKTISFSMQSNLTLLTEAHIEAFTQHQVMVGVSLDGDKATHNEMRGGFSNTSLNIRRLQNAGLFSGAIIVVSHHNWNKIEAFFSQLNQLGIQAFHMNIASAVGRGNALVQLGADKTFQAFKSCVDCMLHYDGAIIDTRMIAKLKRFLYPPDDGIELLQQLKCDNVFCHAGVTMVSVQYNGDVFPCGCAGSSGNMKNFKLHNLSSKLDESPTRYYETLEAFHQKKKKYYEECASCPARFICEHGCPAFDHTDPVTPENTCSATKNLYQYLQTLDRKQLSNLVEKFG